MEKLSENDLKTHLIGLLGRYLSVLSKFINENEIEFKINKYDEMFFGYMSNLINSGFIVSDIIIRDFIEDYITSKKSGQTFLFFKDFARIREGWDF
jgi:hypothetical protein